MSLISSPGNDPVDRQTDKGMNVEVNQGWRVFFTAVFNLLTALTQSGPTADRPLKFLWVSRTYFDTDLGIPIWWDGTQWIDAAGTPV